MAVAASAPTDWRPPAYWLAAAGIVLGLLAIGVGPYALVPALVCVSAALFLAYRPSGDGRAGGLAVIGLAVACGSLVVRGALYTVPGQHGGSYEVLFPCLGIVSILVAARAYLGFRRARRADRPLGRWTGARVALAIGNAGIVASVAIGIPAVEMQRTHHYYYEMCGLRLIVLSVDLQNLTAMTGTFPASLGDVARSLPDLSILVCPGSDDRVGSAETADQWSSYAYRPPTPGGGEQMVLWEKNAERNHGIPSRAVYWTGRDKDGRNTFETKYVQPTAPPEPPAPHGKIGK